MQKLLKYIDNLICNYLGIHEQEVNLDSIKKIGNDLVLRKTESYQRYLYNENLDKFLTTNSDRLSAIEQKKLGLSMGKAIANNLIVSFESTQIRSE